MEDTCGSYADAGLLPLSAWTEQYLLIAQVDAFWITSIDIRGGRTSSITGEPWD